jgi:hypothetical protein
MEKPTLVIDGNDFSTLEGFLLKIRDVLAPSANDEWIHNLDAFNDELYRGDEKPQEDFTLVWKNSATSKDKLSYAETVRQLEKRLQKCHPLNRAHVQKNIEAAKKGEGTTVFDWLVEIIGVHEDIELRLE